MESQKTDYDIVVGQTNRKIKNDLQSIAHLTTPDMKPGRYVGVKKVLSSYSEVTVLLENGKKARLSTSRNDEVKNTKQSKVTRTSVPVITDLTTIELPKAGLITLNTWIHFGPHEGMTLGNIIDIDKEWIRSIVNNWPRNRIDGLVLKHF